HRLQRRSRELALRNESFRGACVDALPVVATVVTRGQDDGRRLGELADELGYLEAVHVGEPDIEQDDIRPKSPYSGDSALPIRRLAHHVEALPLKQRARPAAEPRVIVHDQ